MWFKEAIIVASTLLVLVNGNPIVRPSPAAKVPLPLPREWHSKGNIEAQGPYFEGDMRLNDDQMAMVNGIKSGIIGSQYRWVNGWVLVDIDPAFSQAEYNEVYNALKEIEGKTCVRFYLRDPNYPYWVNIKRGGAGVGCNSWVGRQGQGGQDLNLGPGCVYMGIIAHELMHAIGFFHEQSRTDRDDYVTVNWGNIATDNQHNFNKYEADYVDPFGRGYDYKSVMHYGGYDFALDGSQPTLIPKMAGWGPGDLGQRDGLTSWDADKINNMYAGICV